MADFIGIPTYICGTNPGIMSEDVMPERNGFKNIYEETKYDAEKMVRESGLPFTIFRPSVLIGDSKTGATATARHEWPMATC